LPELSHGLLTMLFSITIKIILTDFKNHVKFKGHLLGHFKGHMRLYITMQCLNGRIGDLRSLRRNISIFTEMTNYKIFLWY